MRRHEGERGEVLDYAQILSLSLAATNGSDTPPDSLAAQAVALRSRGIWWMDYCKETDSQGRAPHHLCDSPAHGLPYLSMEELISLYGEEEANLRAEAGRVAVERTKGMVLTYEDDVIPALLHHASVGHTRAVESLPWLSRVSSPEAGGEWERKIPSEEFRLSLAASFGIELSPDPWEWSLETLADGNGWVKQVTIGEKAVSGDEFAHALALPSVAFSMEVGLEGVIVTACGEGSGCGLSRQGASVYARGGLTWQEILAHYYPECRLERME